MNISAIPPNRHSSDETPTMGLVVEKRAADAHDDVEEAGEEEGAVQHAGELALIVHGALRGRTVEGHGEAQTAHTEHLGELLKRGGPQEGGLKVELVVKTTVDNIENDGGHESQQTSNGHERHRTKITK